MGGLNFFLLPVLKQLKGLEEPWSVAFDILLSTYTWRVQPNLQLKNILVRGKKMLLSEQYVLSSIMLSSASLRDTNTRCERYTLIFPSIVLSLKTDPWLK